MVDLDFVAFKLIEQEKAAKQAARNKELGLMGTIVYTVQMVYKTHNVEVCFELDSAKKFEAMLNAHLEAGFEKRVFTARQDKEKPATFPDQQGMVLGVGESVEKWNNKPLYPVEVHLSDGNVTKVNVFDAKLFRKGDKVDYKVGKNGYAKIEHFGGAMTDDVPF